MRHTHRATFALALLLAGCGEDPIERDVNALLFADAPARVAAAKALADQHDPRVAPALAKALKDAQPDVRCAAAEALGRQPADIAVPALLDLLAKHDATRECTYAPLAQLGDARAATPLVMEAARKDNAKALAALGTLGPPAIDGLVGALRNESDPGRAAELARVLVQAGGPQALAPLLALGAENNRQANANAALALGLLGDARALPALVKAANAGIGPAPRALLRLGQPGIEALLDRFASPSDFQRRVAADTLAQATDPAVVKVLESLLASANALHAAGSAQTLVRMADTPGLALQADAAAALERAWQGGDAHAIAAALPYFLARHPETEDAWIELLEMHGDAALADAYIASASPTLKAAGTEWRKQSALPPPVAATTNVGGP